MEGLSTADKHRNFLVGGLAALDADLRSRGGRLILGQGDPRVELARLRAESDAAASTCSRPTCRALPCPGASARNCLMPTFDYTFTAPASLEAVRAFHHDTRALKKLTPPPVFAQIHRYEPLGEGSRAEFTLWFGPLPLRWVAVHRDVNEHGFTDIQVEGPLARWRHTHRFTPVDAYHTRISEHIEYEHKPGLWGWFTRLLFGKPGLWALFTARQMLTRWHLRTNLRTD